MKKTLIVVFGLVFLFACNEQELMYEESNVVLKSGRGKAVGQNDLNFSKKTVFNVGGEGAAEISAFCSMNNLLFVVNNEAESKIDILDLNNLEAISDIGDLVTGGGAVNSVAVKNGLLAAAVEANVKTDNGKIKIYDINNLAMAPVEVEVGALPDMVTFSPDGKLIVCANEGEPNQEYTIDPIGSISIIEVENGFAVTTLDFSGFETQKDELMAMGLRVFGPGASFAQDMEPEYVTIEENSEIAWIALQENNAMAKVDLTTKSIIEIQPLGFKNYDRPQNIIDVSDEDGVYKPARWPVFGMYQPDAIAVLTDNGIPYVFTANEGDSRDYVSFSEEARVKDDEIVLDREVFQNADYLKEKINMGRLKITTTLGRNSDSGDEDEYKELYSFGARSFSVWDGNTGTQVFDSRTELDRMAVFNGSYADNRSDDKSIEPEGLAIGNIGNIKLLFVGLERVDAVAVYDITNPRNPKYLQWLDTGDAPEGLVFVPKDQSPNGESMLIVSSEDDGNISIYTTEDMEI